MWAVNRADADEKGGIKQKRKFPQKVMVWLGACSKGVTPLVILDEGTVDHSCYIEKVLPVALKYGNEVFGNNWIFQQDGAKPHQHHLRNNGVGIIFHHLLTRIVGLQIVQI